MRGTRSHKLKTRCTTTLNRIPSKKLRFTDFTVALPEEVLLRILSYFTHEELYETIRLVCKRWFYAVSSPILWKKITVDNTVPTEVVCKWLEHSPLLRQISLIKRHDINTITAKLCEHCPNLKSLVVKNCWGSVTSTVINGRPLCRLITKCAKLTHFDFSQSKIRSVKFFKLLGEKGGQKMLPPCVYLGWINAQQVDALMRALIKNDDNCLSLLYGNDNRLTVSHCARIAVALQYFWSNVLSFNNETGEIRAGLRAEF